MKTGRAKPARNKPIYLADLFIEFQSFAERAFSAERMLQHIEQAKSPTPRGVPWGTDEQRIKHRHVYERQLLRRGLALYLFDRFLHSEDGRLDDILVETDEKQFRPIGQTVFTKVGNLYFSRIDYWRNVSAGRLQLLEIAGGYSAAYPLLETTLWTVIAPKDDNWAKADILDEGEYSDLITAWDEIAPFSGLPLWFRGRKPTKKEIRSLLGKTTWLDDEHIAILAQDLYRHYRLLPDGKLFQDDAARFIGIEKNTRSFPKIWRAFRELLTPEEIEELPKRGEKKGRKNHLKGI